MPTAAAASSVRRTVLAFDPGTASTTPAGFDSSAAAALLQAATPGRRSRVSAMGPACVARVIVRSLARVVVGIVVRVVGFIVRLPSGGHTGRGPDTAPRT